MNCPTKLTDFLELKHAWIKGYIQFRYWANIIRYLYGDISPYNIKKLFKKAVSNDIFYIKKIDHRLFYKYKSVNEDSIYIGMITFN